MKKISAILLIITGMTYAKPVVFKDFGAIWMCGDYTVWAEPNAKTIGLSNEKLHLDKNLQYKKNLDAYFSKDGKTSLRFQGKSLDDPKIIFIIDGKKQQCYYEYIERG